MANVSTVAAQNADYSQSSQSSKKLADDMNAFLTLLTAQLSHQDPLDPMDSSEFTNQLVQYAGVEQQIDTNEHLESLMGLTQASTAASAVSYIGKQVQAESSMIPLQGEEAKFTYTLLADASKAVALIKDADGNIIRSLEIDQNAGTHHVVWDGKDKNGEQMPPGAYGLSIDAEDTYGNTMEDIYTTVTGTATAVASDGDDILIAAGAVLFGFNYIVSVSDIPAKAAETTDDTSDDASSSDDTTADDTSSSDDTTTDDTTSSTDTGADSSDTSS